MVIPRQFWLNNDTICFDRYYISLDSRAYYIIIILIYSNIIYSIITKTADGILFAKYNTYFVVIVKPNHAVAADRPRLNYYCIYNMSNMYI